MRHLETLFALQTAHLRATQVEEREDASQFLPQWPDDSPTSEADAMLLEFGSAYRVM